MCEDIRQALTEKIRNHYGLSAADAAARAKDVVEKCPQVMMKNVREWAEGMPLTDIFAGPYSLPMILAIWHSSDFLRALEVMEELLEGRTETAELRIWEMRR